MSGGDKAAIEAAFIVCRNRLQKDFKGDHHAAARSLDPLLERKMVERFFKPEDVEPSGKFSLQNKKRLIHYYGGGRERVVYDFFAENFEQNADDALVIARRLEGVWKYRRFFARSLNPNDLKYVEGTIKIEPKDDLPYFSHWSHNWAADWTKKEPEHTGYIFTSGSQMFMLGSAKGTLRLAIVDLPAVPKSEVLTGLVVSRRSRSPFDPFAARFAMIYSDNAKILAELSDETPIHPEKIPRTKGEEAFFTHTKGRYSFYMLSIPSHDEEI